MADPVSLAWTFLLSFTPSTLALLLTASLSSPQTTLSLLPLHTTPVPLTHVTSPTRNARPSPGTQVSGTALLVTPLNGGAGVAQGRSDLKLGDIIPNLFPPPPLARHLLENQVPEGLMLRALAALWR